MNPTKLFAYIIITLGLGLFPIGKLRAAVVEFVSISVTTFEQNTNYDNGLNTITASPRTKTYNTTALIKRLAADAFAKGNWPSNNFPASARLAVMPSQTNNFVVIAGTNILVNVSDIISFQNGDNEITSGKQSDSTGLALPKITKRQIARITFDDTSAGNPSGGLAFYLQGALTQTTTDSTPISGVYTETHTASMINAAGEGSSSIATPNQKPFVCKGTIMATGKTKLPL